MGPDLCVHRIAVYSVESRGVRAEVGRPGRRPLKYFRGEAMAGAREWGVAWGATVAVVRSTQFSGWVWFCSFKIMFSTASLRYS